MKKVKMSLLALAAIVGVSAAFTTKSNAAKAGFSYGITGLTTNGHGYVIVAFDNTHKTCDGATSTCAITSATARTSPVATNASGISKKPGVYTDK